VGGKLADFEGLIRQALARQNDADPAIRQRIYESSRRALARMIASAGMQPPEIIARQHESLESAIHRVEEDYLLSAMDIGNAAIDRARWHGGPAPDHDRGADQTAHLEPQFEPGEQEYYEPNLSALPRRRSAFARSILILGLLLALALTGWLIYFVTESYLGAGSSSARGDAAQTGDASRRDGTENADYITILSPQDTGALDTAGRGTAEIVNQSNIEMIRLVSLRPEEKRNEPAPPITLTLSPGVLLQISGKRITIEILAKSGSPGPVGFAVGCEFDGQDLCGRKRFRVGIQPEAIVFTVNVQNTLKENSSAFLTISTDITGSAALTGAGDPVDILYARLRVPKEQ